MNTTPQRATAGAHVALLAVSLLFGGLYVAARVASPHLPGALLAFLRATIGLCVLAPVTFAVTRKDAAPPRLDGKDHVHLFVLGLLGIACNQLFFMLGIRHVSAVQGAFLVASTPVMTATLAVFLGREQRPVRTLLGVVVAGSGVAWLLSGSAQEGGGSLVGSVLILLNCFSYSLYLIFQRNLVLRLGAWRFMRWVLLWGAVCLLPLALFSGREVAFAAVPASAWLAVLYMGLGATAFTYSFNAWAVSRGASPALVAVYIYVQPLVAGWLGWSVLAEAPRGRSLIAGMLILAGVAVVALRPAMPRTRHGQ